MVFIYYNLKFLFYELDCQAERPETSGEAHVQLERPSPEVSGRSG